MGNEFDERILVLAPVGKDAFLIERVLAKAGFTVHPCKHAEELCQQLCQGAGVVVVAEEGIPERWLPKLLEVLRQQPPWSDLPLLVLTSAGITSRHSARLAALFDDHINLGFLERPLRMLTLVSAVQSALRSRRKQYLIRRLLERSVEEVKQRDQFIAMLGHELRNPLATIQTATDIAVYFGARDPQLVTQQCETIARQSKNMARLVDDLLDVARITSGRIELSKTEIDLVQHIEQSIQAIRLALPEQSHAVTVVTPGEPILIDGDAVRLEQVVTNLISNAIRYSPAGGPVTVSVSTDGECAVIKVKDSGEGIDRKLVKTIFQPFVQSDRPLARSKGGLGLGLTVVRSLVELHGGSVEAHSDGPGCGSEFTVRLPIRSSAAAKECLTTGAVDGHLRPRTILVIEDNADARQTMVQLLTLLGHVVQEAATGGSGLKQLLAFKPDVAFVDIGLPEIDGYQVAIEARKQLGDSVFLVALTGYGQREDQQKTADAGFDAHLAKPAGVEAIKQLLQNLDSLRAQGRSSRAAVDEVVSVSEVV